MTQIKVELQDFMGDDKAVAEAAWTSSLDYQAKETRTDADVTRIVNMLADLKHSVPFESVIFRFWIKLPIQTDRQHMTHRIASNSGMSGRYRTMPSEFLSCPNDVNSILDKAFGEDVSQATQAAYNILCTDVNNWYRHQLTKFKAKEKAGIISNSEYKRLREFFRGALPQNNMTERVTIINLRSLANYLKLRKSESAQVEIREIAEQMYNIIKEKNICPIAFEALERNNWVI